MDSRCRTLNQLLAESPPKIYYLIRPLFPVGGTIIIAGDVKTFKSHIALNLGYALAGGSKFLGYWEVVKPLSVLYIEMEVGEYELRERGNVIHSYHANQVAGENLHVISKDMRIQLDTRQGLEVIAAALGATQADVLILDPIVEFHSQDENSAIAMKKMLWPLRQMLQPNRTSLVLVHHTAKSSEYRPGNNPASIRGSYLAGMANTLLNLEKPVKGRDDIIKINFTCRSAKAPHPMTLTFDEASGGFK